MLSYIVVYSTLGLPPSFAESEQAGRQNRTKLKLNGKR